MNLERIGSLARKALQKSGFDLVRFRSLNTVLTHHGIDLVFDVGANVGQYGSKLRELGYRGKIVSFEPQKQAFAELSAAATRDPKWETVNIGLGSEDGQKTINVYDQTVLSSILTLDQRTAFPGARQTGTETIEIRTLDGLIGQYAATDSKIMLKIDTQGFEKQVLQGAERSLPRLSGIQIELSLTPIYDGQPQMEEMIALLRSKGFMLWQMQRGLCKMETGQELEADGVFIRAATQ